MATVALIDDDASTFQLLEPRVRSGDITLVVAPSGYRGLELVAATDPDLVLLSLTPADIPGIEVLWRLRNFSTVPVIALSVADRPEDKVKALRAGADDYVSKPFDGEELLARIEALLRRTSGESPTSVLRFEDVTIDLFRRRVLVVDADVHFTKTEFDLLRALATRPGQTLFQSQLLEEVWPQHAADAADLRVYIHRLREKLHDDAEAPRCIATEVGLGYRWVAQQSKDLP